LYPLIVAGALIGSTRFGGGTQWHFPPDLKVAVLVLLAVVGLPSPQTGFRFDCFPMNPPEWSLVYELLAYVAFGALILRCKSWHLIAVTVAAFALYAVTDFLWFGQDDSPFWIRSFGAAASFCMGVLLWRYRRQAVLVRPGCADLGPVALLSGPVFLTA
jgi:peptidoglycan/LPS O-acetylase OafA/YrhL